MDNKPTDKIIIEHLQTLHFSTISNMHLGREDHITIEKLISDRRAITNARNRLNYKIRSLQDRNHQIKSPSQLQPKGRKPKAITDQEIQIYILKQVKPVKATSKAIDGNIR